MASWVYELRRFSDDVYLGLLDGAKGRSMSPALNNAGGFACTVELDSDAAYLVEKLKTYVNVLRNGAPFASGKVYNITEDAAANKMGINCLGWFEELNRRYTQDKLEFTGKTLGSICWGLIGHSVAVDGPLGFNVGPESNSIGAGFVVEKLIVEKDQNIGQQIRELTAVENGVDFYHDFAQDCFVFVNRLGSTKPNAQFGFMAGANNLANVTRTQDGSRTVNKFKAISQRTNNFTVNKDDALIVAQGTYAEIQTINVRATTTAQEQANLNAFGAGEIAVRGNGVTTYELTPQAEGSGVDTPMPPVDFDVGDTVSLSVDRGAFQLSNQGIRVFGYTLTIEDDDSERLSSLALSL